MPAHPDTMRQSMAGAAAAHAGAVAPGRLAEAAEDLFYPSSDGEPMAQNMWQGDAIVSTAGDLKVARPGALVAADVFVYPERGNRNRKVAPDVLVAFGVGGPPADELQGVARGQAAGLGAGGGVAEHGGAGSGLQGALLRRDGRARVLAVRPERPRPGCARGLPLA